MATNNWHNIPPETLIEVIAISETGRVYKKEMTFEEALKINKKPGWTYRNYQLGYSAFKTEN